MPRPPRQRTLAGFQDDWNSQATPTTETAPVVAPLDADDADPSETLDGQTVYVVDAHSLIFQVFHALPEMSSPTGQPAGAIHGFIRDILELLENKQPDVLLCAFDAAGDTFRHQLYDRYKLDREEMPADLRLQIPNIRRMLAALGVPVLELAGYEADDIMATVARRVEQLGGKCFLVTGDKDCRQLITERVKVYNIRKDQVYGSTELERDWGILPEQAVDFQALVGDSIDNVPGVPLIGPKIAGELLRKYGTLEEVLDHAHEISGKKRRENLLLGREQALLSRRLVRLDAYVPIEIDWKAGRVGGVDRGRVFELCREFGFRQLGERLARLSVAEAPAQWHADYRAITTVEQLKQLVAQLSQQKRVVIDTAATSPYPRWADIVGYAIAWQAGQAYYVPVRAPQGEPQFDPQTTLELLRPILEDPAIEKIGHNLKYDMVVLRCAGVQLQGAVFDTMVADYLLAPGERNHNLDDLAVRYLNHATMEIGALIGSGRNPKPVDQVSIAQFTQYAGQDADVPLRLAPILERLLRQENLEKLFADLEMPLVEVLAELEHNGIKVDVQRLHELSRRFGERMQVLQAEVYEIAGGPFNIDSRIQLSQVLFEKLHLPVIKKTKSGPSTDADVLAELASLHALPEKIVQYRQDAKLKSTYVDALPALVHPKTGRVHTSFKQDVAATGRLSSTDPNLQNIPVRSKVGREIRTAFLPGQDGWQLVAGDYSQIELRILAHLSGDAALQSAFAEDRDIHAQVASEVYGIPLDQVTWDMRRSAKAINFGIIYGQSAFGLAKALSIDKQQAAQFIDAYFNRYVDVQKFIVSVLEQARRMGYVSTILGRRRAVQGVRDPSKFADARHRNLPERIAVNTVIQGSAADLIKQAMINVYRRLRRESLVARMLLQIHDELIFESPASEIAQLAKLVSDEMSSVAALDVPLKVDIKVGSTWADCEPITEGDPI